MQAANERGVALILPMDHVTGDAEKKNPRVSDSKIPADRLGLDIGPKTVARFADEIRKARMVLWNGPVGLFEVAAYSEGTRALAHTLAENHARLTSIIAGGDTVAAVAAAGVESQITHLSTGGGATLEFLEGRELPGIQALEDNA
jgi:phosphoglycerate kinase